MPTRVPKPRPSHPASAKKHPAPSIGTRLRSHQRTAQKNRLSRRMRCSRMIAQAAVSEELEALDLSDVPQRPLKHRLLSYLGALFLAPFIALTALTLVHPIQDSSFMLALGRSQELFHFGIGAVLMLAWFWSRLFYEQFLYLYVLGHEWTHAVFVWASLGRVKGIRVSVNGGFVISDRSNPLIALSPYFVPFWSVVIVFFMNLAGYAFEVPVPKGFLLILLGGSWCFHIVWTLWMLTQGQPDLLEYGRTFSLAVIMLANLLLLAAIAILSSPDLTVISFLSAWLNHYLDYQGAILDYLEARNLR